MHLSTAILSSAPVIDVDGTLAIQGVLFLFLMAILNQMLFKPWLEVRDRREARIGGAHEDAERRSKEVAAKEEEYESRIQAAREEARGERSSAYREAEAEQAKVVATARKDAEGVLNSERARIDEESSKARQSLSARVGELADEITAKILGRAA